MAGGRRLKTTQLASALALHCFYHFAPRDSTPGVGVAGTATAAATAAKMRSTASSGCGLDDPSQSVCCAPAQRAAAMKCGRTNPGGRSSRTCTPGGAKKVCVRPAPCAPKMTHAPCTASTCGGEGWGGGGGLGEWRELTPTRPRCLACARMLIRAKSPSTTRRARGSLAKRAASAASTASSFSRRRTTGRGEMGGSGLHVAACCR